MQKVQAVVCFFGSVGNASAYWAKDSGFESRIRLFEKAENMPVLSGRLVHNILVFFVP